MKETRRSSMLTVAKGLAVAEVAPPRAPLFADDFDRTLDAGIIKIRARDPASQTAALEGTAGVLVEIHFAADLVGKLHILRFKVAEGLAEQRAKKFVQLQKTAKGWRRLTAANEDEEEVPLRVDGDENKQMVRTGERSVCKVYLDWIPLARVLVESEDRHNVEWSFRAADGIALDRGARDALEVEVRLVCSTDEDAQWEGVTPARCCRLERGGSTPLRLEEDEGKENGAWLSARQRRRDDVAGDSRLQGGLCSKVALKDECCELLG